MPNTQVTVDQIPDCDMCKDLPDGWHRPAYVDGKTIMGPWAYMCSDHFQLVGVGLGLGLGQELILSEEGK